MIKRKVESHLPCNISLQHLLASVISLVTTDSRYPKHLRLIIDSEQKALTPHFQDPLTPFGQLTTLRPGRLEETVS